MRTILLITAFIGIGVSAPVEAHHGPPSNDVLYLTDEMIEIEGELIDVLWRNPHVRARVRVGNEIGADTTWELEFGPSPRALEGRGVQPENLLGSVKAAGYVSKRNPNSLGVMHLLLPDGQELVQGRRELRWSTRSLASGTASIDSAKVAAAERSADGIFRVWGRRSGLGAMYRSSVSAQPLTQTGQELAAAFDPIYDDRELHCEQGMPDTMFDPVPLEIIDEGVTIVIRVQQADVERIIHMGVAADAAGAPSPLGFSQGHWDGGALVVTTSQVDWPYYSVIGVPQSTDVSYTERFSVTDDGRVLNYSLTISDPVVFTESFTIDVTRDWAPGIDVERYDCAANWAPSTN